MANRKITSHTELAATPAAGDFFQVVDVSDTTDAASGTNKKIKREHIVPSAAETKTAYESNADTNAYDDAAVSKLAGIEAAADVTDATNVDAAGAVMEADYGAQTILAATADDTPAALTVAEQTLVGRITGGNVDALTAAQVRTLLNVEDGAAADPSAAEVKTLYESNADTNAFTDADESKLDGIESGADVTDTANVTAAGALMDSEVDADIKTLTLPASTTISVFGASLVDDATAADARTTLDVDQAGTDNSTPVTLAGSLDYLSISGQQITRNPIDLATDIELASLAQYDVLYAAGVNGLARLATNATATNKFLRTVSSGAPSYEVLVASDIPDISGTYALAGHDHTGTYQPLDSDLTDIAGLSSADGNIIVGSATGWVVESGATFRISIGLGNVEDTALSTWAGSANITTLGTIATGTMPWANLSGVDAGVAATPAVTANTAKVTNATHTGQVTGSGALIVDATAVSDQTLVTAVGTDHVLILDATDGTLKKALISDFASAGGDMASATYDDAGIAEQLVGLTAEQTLSNKTLTAPVIAQIVSVSNGTIDISPHGTGDVQLGTLVFDGDQTVGAGQDNYVLTYDNGTGLITLEAGGAGDALTSGSLAQFAATTSAELAGVISDETGSGLLVFATSPTLVTPVIAQINDANGNEILLLPATASALNHVSITNAITGEGPTIAAVGDEADVDLRLVAKGGGVITLGAAGTATTIWDFAGGANDKLLSLVQPDHNSWLLHFTNETWAPIATYPDAGLKVMVTNTGQAQMIHRGITTGVYPVYEWALEDGDGQSSRIVVATIQETGISLATGTTYQINDVDVVDQDVTSGSAPTLTGTNFTGIPVSGLANGTDGELITWNASGVAETVAAGTSGQVLTSNGAGAAPTFEDAAAGGLSNVAEDTSPQLGGDLDMNGNQITSPDGTDLIDIPNGSITLQTASTSRLDITDSGVRLGGANARVTTVLDEDAMGSNSATALATQQSIKAYVDSVAGVSLSGYNLWTMAQVSPEEEIIFNATTMNWNTQDKQNAYIELTADVTDFTVGTLIAAGGYCTLRLIQGGSGSYTFDFSACEEIELGGFANPTLNTGVGEWNLFSFWSDGTTLHLINPYVVDVLWQTILPLASISAVKQVLVDRVTSTASSSTPTPDNDTTDQYNLAALAANATFGAPSGTPYDGQSLTIRVKDNGTSRTLAWNAIYVSTSNATLPTATTISKELYVHVKYSSAASKWHCVGVTEEV